MSDDDDFYSIGTLSDDDEEKKKEEQKRLEEERKKKEEEEKKKKEQKQENDFNTLKSNFLVRRASLRTEHKKNKSPLPKDNKEKKLISTLTKTPNKASIESPIKKNNEPNKLNIGSIKISEFSEIYDWLNAHHFDYCGLIEKGLALEAPEEMYKTE
jgi:hypothetical protein